VAIDLISFPKPYFGPAEKGLFWAYCPGPGNYDFPATSPLLEVPILDPICLNYNPLL